MLGRSRYHKLLDFLTRVYHVMYGHGDDESSRHQLAERLCGNVYPQLKFSERGKTWWEDREFFAYYDQVRQMQNRTHSHCADRKFFLRSLLGLVQILPGDTAECGVYQGATSYLICEFFDDRKSHHAFDSFEGLSQPNSRDGSHWSKHDLKADEKVARRYLQKFTGLQIHKGWIPDCFEDVKDRTFCFVHVDVDIYQPTLDSFSFFYPRLVPGGIMLCDDYGFNTCPGARQAFDEFMHDRPENIVHVPTGQAFVVKRNAA